MKLYFLALCILLTSSPVVAENSDKPKKSKTGKLVTAIKVGTTILDVGANALSVDRSLKDLKKDAEAQKKAESKPAPMSINRKDTKLARDLTAEAWRTAKSGNHETARKLYISAFEYDNGNWNIYHKYAWSLLQLEQLQAAESAYRTAISLGGNDHTWLNLGRTLMEQGKKHAAKKCYEKAYSLNRANTTAKNMIDRMDKEIVADVKKSIVQKSMPTPTTEKAAVEKNPANVNWYAVRAQPSLSMRSNPFINSQNKVAQLPNGISVKLIKLVGKPQLIDGKKGHWALIEHGTMQGYVFSAYLTKKR